jgi:pre-rRNA-processing protein TSR3
MLYEVIIDSGETANKCTIMPLSYRPDFCLFRVKGAGALGPLSSSILLHHEGRCLTEIKGSLSDVNSIASIDCVWRRLNGLIRRIKGTLPVFVRIPDGFETAYPRRSLLRTDPAGGLATIEAIFVASALLGNWDVSLLSEYYFGRDFVKKNERRFLDLGVRQAADQDDLPVLLYRSRNSLQRRRNRGRSR